MELRQLAYFRKIAETGSINEAARRLNLSQPPLSAQLRQLEDELGVRLFERTRRGVELTDAGRLLYERSGSLLEFVQSTRQEVAETGRRRVLRMGITSTTVGVILPYIAWFSRLHPEVSFEVRDGASHALLQQLMDGIIDISVARTPLRTDEVDLLTLGTEPMIAVSAPALRTDGGEAPRLSSLCSVPLILYRRYEELILCEFRRQGLSPDVFCICDDARDAMLWAAAGLATAIFPESMRGQCAGLRIRTLDEPSLFTQTVLIWRKGRRPSAVVQDFLAVVKEIRTERAPG